MQQSESNGRTVMSAMQSTETSRVTSRRQSESLSTTTLSATSTTTLAQSHQNTQSLATAPYFANRKTGQSLTLQEALQTGLLDPKRGAYIDPVSGNALSLADAASAGLIDPRAASALTHGSLGLRDPRTGQTISLLQAIQLGLYDAGKGGFVHPQTREAITIEEAVQIGVFLRDKVSTLVGAGVVRTGPPHLVEALQLGWVDYGSGFVTVPHTGVRCSLHEAVVSGLVRVESRIPPPPSTAGSSHSVHLYDAVALGHIDSQTRTFLDRPSGQRVSLAAAVQRRLIEAATVCVVDGRGRRLTLEQAVDSGLIDLDRCALNDFESRSAIPLESAVRQKRIVKPLTLKECVDQELIDPNGTFVDPVTSVRLNLLKAVEVGFLDVDTKSVVDSHTGGYLTLAECLSEGIILPSGLYVEKPHGTTIPLVEAAQMGLLLSSGTSSLSAAASGLGRRGSSIVDPPPGGWPLKDAIERRMLDTSTGMFAVPGTDRLVSFEECIHIGIVHPDSATVLDPVTSRYISIVRAFEKKLLSPTGQYRDTSKTLTLREALNRYCVIFVEDDSTSPTIIRGMSPRRDRQASVDRELRSVRQTPPPSPSMARRGTIADVNVVPWEGLPTPDLQDIRVASGIIFSPSSGTVRVEQSGETVDLLEAVKRNIVQPGKVKVRDPASVSKELSMAEAIRKGIVSKETGDYKYSGGRTLSLVDALHVGVIVVSGRPASEPEIVEESSPSAADDPSSTQLAWKVLRIKLVDPLTGAEVSWESAIERHIVDSDSVLQFARPIDQLPAVRFTAELKNCVVLSDVATGQQMVASEALDRGVVTEKRLVELIQEQKPVYRLMDTTGIDLSGGDDFGPSGRRKMSLADEARMRITMEPKFSVALGRARSSQTEQPAKLQRIRRRVMKPREAAARGFIDGPTAELLEACRETGSVESHLKRQRIDGTRTGAVCDVLRGQQLTIQEALDRGVLENETAELQFPVACSLSVIEAVERGLFDQSSGRFIHPENGSPLTLAEAIDCDLIDTLTQVVDTRLEEKKTISLSLAIATGLVDAQSGDVQTDRGCIPFWDAVSSSHRRLYQPSTRVPSTLVPPVALTLPVALQRGLVNPAAMEFVHPSTPSRRIPLEEAIEGHWIMAIPFTSPVTATTESVTLVQALQQHVLDVDRKTFVDQSGKKMSVSDALEKGLLVIKAPTQLHYGVLKTGEPTTPAAPTVVTTEVLATRVIQIVAGYTLIGGDQVKNDRTGRIIPLQQAERLGLVVGVPPEQLLFEEAVAEGFINLTSGTFTRPGSTEKMSISQALQEGWIYLDGFDSESLATIRLDPVGDEVTTRTLIYDIASHRAITVEVAITLGILNEHGEYRHAQSSRSFTFVEAVRLGFIVVLGVPVGVGVRVTEAAGTVLFSTKPSRKETTPPPSIYRSRRTSIQMALREERIGSQVQLRLPERKASISLEEAIRTSVATPTAIIAVESSDEVFLIGEPGVRISAVDILNKDWASANGFYDRMAGCFMDESQEPIRVADASALGILDGREILVKDVRCNSFSYLDEALEKLLLDPNTGSVIDPKTGKSVSFFEAVDAGWIVASPSALRAKLGRALTFKEVVAQGLYEADSGLVAFPSLRATVSLTTAIQKDLIDTESIIFRCFMRGEDIKWSRAVELGMVDLDAGTAKTRDDNSKPVDLAKAVATGLIQPKRNPVSLEASVRNGMFDSSSGRIAEPVARKSLTIEESVKWGLIDAFISEVHDVKRRRVMSLEEAIETRIVDNARGRLMNTATNEWLDMAAALNKGLIGTTVTAYTIFDAVDKGLYDAQSGRFSNPFTGGEETLRQAIDSGLIESSSARVQRADGSYISLQKAVDAGELDEHSIDTAIHHNIIVPVHKSLSLQEALSLQLYERESGLFSLTDTNGTREKMTLHKAVQKGLIKKSTLAVKDPRSSDILTLSDAIQAGIIDATSGMAVDPSTGAEMDFLAAVERGLIISARRKLSVTEALLKGLYDSQSGRFSTTLEEENKPKLPTYAAIKGGVIDPSSNLVRHHKTGRLVSFDQAVQEGLIDVKQGAVRISATQTVDFQQALDRGMLVEVQRPIFLSEAMVKEVFDEKTGLFLDPMTGQWLTLAEALENGLIDPESVHVKDTRTGFLRKISLSVAIDLGLINGRTATITDQTTNKEYSLSTSFAKGLIIDSRAPISIQRMIHQGLYDETTGRVIDPNSGLQITVHEALRRCVLHPGLPCYFDRQSGRPLSLAETCRNGIIDRQTGWFRLPQSKLEMPLNQALERELILDIERPFSLYEALHVGFFDETRNCFVHPSNGRHLNLDAACKEELVDASKSIVKHSKTGRYMKLTEAISIGLIDAERSVYCLSEGSMSSRELTLLEALSSRLIVTSRKGLTLEEAIRNGLYSPETGKFIDPSVGDLLDLNQALEHGLVDPTTSALVDPITGNLKSLKSALGDGEVDGVRGRLIQLRSKRSISLEAALEQRLIVTVDRALTFDQAVRAGAIDLKLCTFVDPRTSRQSTLEEAIRLELIDPESAVIKDPRTGRFTTVKRAIDEGVVDMRKRAIFDPNSGRLAPLCLIFEQGTVVFHRQCLSFDEAIDQGALDLQTARITEPVSQEELNLKQAVAVGCLDPDTVMVKDHLRKQLLNLSVGLELALVDAEQGRVLDNSSGLQLSLSEALEAGLLITPKRRISLIDALVFGLYGTETGRFSDPFAKRTLSLREAIEDAALLDPSTTLAKDPETGRILPLLRAIADGLVDASAGLLAHLKLSEALAQGYLLTTHDRVSLTMIRLQAYLRFILGSGSLLLERFCSHPMVDCRLPCPTPHVTITLIFPRIRLLLQTS